MSIFLCATEETMAICLAQHLASAPLGILAIGTPFLPQTQQAEALPTVLLAWTPGADLTTLQTCDPIAILADATHPDQIEDLQALQHALHELASADHTLVFAPAAAPLAGIEPGTQAAVPADGAASRPLLPAIILTHIAADGHVADLLPYLGPRGRLLALDGPVYVEYTPTRQLIVHGAGSVLVLVPDTPGQDRPVAAKAFILTDGMTQTW